jgi:hypothetical protein
MQSSITKPHYRALENRPADREIIVNAPLTFRGQSDCNIRFHLDHGCTGTDAKRMTKGRFQPGLFVPLAPRSSKIGAPFFIP